MEIILFACKWICGITLALFFLYGFYSEYLAKDKDAKPTKNEEKFIIYNSSILFASLFILLMAYLPKKIGEKTVDEIVEYRTDNKAYISECRQFSGAWIWIDTLVLDNYGIAYKRVGFSGTTLEQIPVNEIKVISLGGKKGKYWVEIKPKKSFFSSSGFDTIKFYFRKTATMSIVEYYLKQSYNGIYKVSTN